MKKIKDSTKENINSLEHPDYFDDTNFLKVESQYTELIGQLLIDFSYLEHLLNCVIAEFINKDNFSTGYSILETQNINQKIELFYKFYVTLISSENSALKEELIELKKELIRVKTLRNNIVHANWQTMDSRHYTRTKIIVESGFGNVTFKNIQITPRIIKSNILKIGVLMDRIWDFTTKTNKI
jgi:hypothetical protein